MTDKRWKRAERDVARLLGGRRLPVSGKAEPDVVTDTLAAEVKCRTLPDWLKNALDQASGNAPEGLTPVVVLVDSQRGIKARRVVVMELERFQGTEERRKP